jgi:hypothetical protein
MTFAGWTLAVARKLLIALGLLAASMAADPGIVISEPVLVAESPAEERRWGYYQFPVLDRLPDGRIALTFHVHPDSVNSYGLAPDRPNRGLSEDGGKTWRLTSSDDPPAGVLLPNGDRLRVVTPRPYPVSGLVLPKPAGERTGTYGKQIYTLFRLRELPEPLRAVHLARLPRGSTAWRDERARLIDPLALRYSLEGLFPIVWLGDMRVAPDKSLLAGVYPGLLDGDRAHKGGVFFYRSVDAGRSWRVHGRILYQPDLNSDPRGEGRDGFTEPAFEILRDGSLLATLRTTDGLGVGPMYSSRSADRGKTWSAPRAFAPTGVLPRLLLLGNGVLVLSSGRPGVDLRFSFDGKGETWSEPFRLVPLSSEGIQVDSCGYTSLLALDDNSFLIAYSWFRRPGEDGQTRKAILVRHVRVTAAAPDPARR